MRRPVLAVLFMAGLILVPLMASGIAVWQAAHTDEASSVDHADAIIVFGAAQYAGDPSPTFQGRLEHGALLYRRGFGDRIVVVGAGQPGDQFTEAEAGATYLIDSGIPAEAVTPSPAGTTTFESLQGAVEVMRESGMETAFLVSDPWHNLRIRRMAEDLGIEGYVSATWQSAARSRGTRIEGYVRETFAYLYYRAFGR